LKGIKEIWGGKIYFHSRHDVRLFGPKWIFPHTVEIEEKIVDLNLFKQSNQIL
jgi:cytosine/adenosine deaminase-related metal-dependent hydrolase